MVVSSPAASDPKRPDRFRAFSVVVLRAGLTTSQGSIPAGARGVVHEARDDGALYLVEFTSPFFCVLDVPAVQLERA